jgi:hypothetical protein
VAARPPGELHSLRRKNEGLLLISKIDLREHLPIVTPSLNHDLILSNLLIVGLQSPWYRSHNLATVQKFNPYSGASLLPLHRVRAGLQLSGTDLYGIG